ncbi:MAG: RsmG family class I SAM-dependent methyltransferase [Acidimicrobiales bacterium]
MTAPSGDTVVALLEEAQRRGFLGPGPVVDHLIQAQPLVAALPASGRVVDLGSGGGVPALPLIAARPDLEWVLVEAQARRASWLAIAVVSLAGTVGAGAVTVVEERAEQTGRGPLRQSAAAVVARSFAKPAVTAECGAPLLSVGGVLWVAEPPAPDPGRWDEHGLEGLGLTPTARLIQGWAGFRLARPVPDRYPRRVGIPAKRPLF